MLKISPGARYGKLTFLAMTQGGAAGKHRIGAWKCDCGHVTNVAITRVVNGYTKSCGCLARVPTNLIHGGKGTKEYRQWGGAKNRCFNPRSKDFSRYGGRGITMCERWRDSFEAFLSDMGPCPDGMSLDRINVDGNYEPSNCQWASAKDQANNRRNTITTEYGNLSSAARTLGISHGAAYMRHKRGKLHA